mgnify:CR=1 FL=1
MAPSTLHRLTILMIVGLVGLARAAVTGQEKQAPEKSPPTTNPPATAGKPSPPEPKPQPKPGDSPQSQQSATAASPRRMFTGRPGELEPEEEDRIEAILDRFIEHDLGVRPDPKAVQEFQALGLEAIPALVRALNRTAPLAQKCPPAMIARKLNSLLLRVQDPEVCDFVRREVGAGIRSGPNVGFLDSVRFNAMLRKRQLLSAPPAPTKSLFPVEPDKPIRSPGEKP